MNSQPVQSLPPRLEAGRERFERWRGRRKARARIPESLWRVAVKLGEEYGVHRTAKALRLNYDALKSRMKAGPAEAAPSASAPTFLELLPSAVGVAGQCVVELDDGHGARMCVHLEHADATVLAALAGAFVRGAR